MKLSDKYRFTWQWLVHSHSVLIAIVLLAIFIVVVLKPITRQPDSIGYLEMNINRPPTYPLFLEFVRQLPILSFSLWTKLLQGGFGVFAIYYLISRLITLLKLNKLAGVFLALILGAPYIYNLNIANYILSEAVAYPLLLMVMASFISFWMKGKMKDFILSMLFWIILILTRMQFLALAPVLLIFAYLKFNEPEYLLWAKIRNVGLIILIPLLTLLLERSYHFYFHNNFVSTPFSGIHLVAAPMYLSNENDFRKLESKSQKKLFKVVHSKLKERKLLAQIRPSNTEEAEFFIENFTEIANHTIFDEGIKVFQNENRNSSYIKLDQINKEITPILLFNRPLPWLKLVLRNFLRAYESNKTFLVNLVLLIVTSIIGFKFSLKRYQLIGMLLTATLFNHLLVALSIYTIKRYLFYFDWVIFFSLIVILTDVYRYACLEFKQTFP